MASTPVERAVKVFTTERSFEWAFACGLGLIGLAKFLTADHPITGGVGASMLGVSIMALYVQQQKKVRSQNEHPRIGDEVYYLGLLFTLVSLCAALVSLFLFEEAERAIQQRTDEMIGSFGIALFTTIAGIVMRMPLQRQGADSRETVIRILRERGDSQWDEPGHGEPHFSGVPIDLERYAYELRRQLDNATNAFASQSNKTIIMARAVQTHMDEIMETFHTGLEKKAQAQLQRLEISYEQVASRAEQAAIQTEVQRAGIQGALERFQAQVKSMDKSVESMRVGSSETVASLGMLNERMNEASSTLEQAGKLVNELADALVSSTDAEAAYQKERADIARGIEDSLKHQVDKWAEIQNGVAVYLEKRDGVDKAMQRLGEEALRTHDGLSKLSSDLQRTGEEAEKFVRSLASVGELPDLKSQAQRLGLQLDAVIEANGNHELALEATSQKARELAEILNSELEGISHITLPLAKMEDFASAAQDCAERIKATEIEFRQVSEGLASLKTALRDKGEELYVVLEEATDRIKRLEETRNRGLRRWLGN